MNDSNLVPLLIAALLFSQSSPPGPAAAPGNQTHHYEKSFPIRENPMLILENTSVRGDTYIQVWDRQEIKVAAEIQSANTSVDATPLHDLLTVKLRRKGKVSADPVHFRVWVPTSCEVEVSGLSGKISVRGVRGRLKASTTDGDIELENLSGRTIDANSSTSGSITLSGPLDRSGTYHLYTATGRIVVTFRDPASFELDATSPEGHIQLDGFSMDSGRRSEHHVEGTIGSGQAVLMLRTVRGTIQLRKR
jgi:DUF4097 and DUF4098 domain-containing protein YvlB